VLTPAENLVVQRNKPNQGCRIEETVQRSWYELGRTMLYAAQVRIPGGVKGMSLKWIVAYFVV
jgi:hypothetical protein